MTVRSQPESYHDQAIEAAYLHTKPGFYFIGPFSRRVSFASQQYRAIDLVNALEAKKKLTDPSTGRRRSVAVIGGGIAGLTAAAMLNGYGCSVEIFERSENMLHLQQAARHRLIHPTINRWPGRPLKYGTKFGFLDWCAGTADQVIAMLRSDWEQHPERLGTGGVSCNAFSKANVTELIHNQRISIRNTATKPNPAEAANRKTYDLAIVTTGFGRESAPKGLTAVSYWTEDELNEWRARADTVYVSGCGDGGLIDCLRLVHGHFDDGWLTVRLAQLLSREMSKDDLSLIEATENDAILIAKSVRCMGYASSANKNLLIDQYDPVYEKLSSFYRNLLSKLPEQAITMLNRSIEAAGVNTGKVRLVAQEAQPFVPSSTPIHKIMLAHAIEQNFVTYRRGKLNKAKSGPKFDLRSGENWPERPDAPIVIRHGPGSPMEGLIGDAEVESLRLRQFMLADFLDVENDRDVPSCLQHLPVNKTTSYYATKLKWVALLMQVVRPGCGVGWDAGGFVYSTFETEEPDQIDELPALEVPDELFGVVLRKESIVELSTL